MLTQVILEGPFGKAFGREWELEVNSAAEALRMINANKPGVFGWIRDNIKIYDRYQVICEYENGVIEELNDDTFPLERKLKKIRFVPIVEGAGGLIQAVVGAVLIALDVFVFHTGWLTKLGIGMVVGGMISALSPRPSTKSKQEGAERAESYYFNGPVNVQHQGAPVPLIYGRCLVGSQTISAKVTVDQLM